MTATILARCPLRETLPKHHKGAMANGMRVLPCGGRAPSNPTVMQGATHRVGKDVMAKSRSPEAVDKLLDISHTGGIYMGSPEDRAEDVGGIIHYEHIQLFVSKIRTKLLCTSKCSQTWACVASILHPICELLPKADGAGAELDTSHFEACAVSHLIYSKAPLPAWWDMMLRCACYESPKLYQLLWLCVLPVGYSNSCCYRCVTYTRQLFHLHNPRHHASRVNSYTALCDE